MRKRLSALLPLVAVLAVAGMTVAAGAASPPTDVPGNPACPAGFTELKVEPVRSGTFSAGGLSVTLAVSGAYFDWTATKGIDQVIVKGGPNARIYTYDPEAMSDAALRAPLNGTKPYGLSHISFCWDVEPDPTPTPAPTPTPTPTPTPDPTPTPAPTPTPTPTPDPTPTPTAQAAPAATATPTPTPRQQVLPEVVVSGRAAIRGRGGCGSRVYTATVSGRRMASVVFRLDGRRVKTVRNAARAVLRLKLSRLSFGTHRLQAQVTFAAASQTAPRTLRLPIARCAQARVSPTFTG